MTITSKTQNQILYVDSFQELISTPYHEMINAICWNRRLKGDFSEIVDKIEVEENIVTVGEEEFLALQLSEQGQVAREIILNDMKLLEEHGASPILNVIKSYERDDDNPYFPTDVYSFHVDYSPYPSDTFLCTYYGESSEILPNEQGEKKVLIPEIRNEIKKNYKGAEEDFESFLTENFLDLHYQAKPDAQPINLGIGNLLRLATDSPESNVLPCLHRAPKEKLGENRLLLIC